MTIQFPCPYCGQPKDDIRIPDVHFGACRFCGFKSALATGESGEPLLIVDRRMPFLKRRCRELSCELPGVEIIVDRRIAQDPFSSQERRAVLVQTPPAKASSEPSRLSQ